MNSPTWTKEVRRGLNQGRDYLGIQNVGNRIMNDLLPGLTGATVHPRHYSFLCWVLAHSDDWGQCRTHKAQMEFLYRFENIMLFASELHEHRYSLSQARPGGNAIRRILRKGNSRFPLDKAGVGRNPSIFDVVNYGPSTNELGLIRRKGDGTLLAPSASRGALLAAEYDKAVKPVEQLLYSLRAAKDISRKDAEKLGDWICPCALSKFPGERAALRSILLGEIDKSSDEDRQRRKSLLLLLSLAQAMPNAEDPSWSFPNAVYYLQAGKKKLPIPSDLDQTCSSWALFQARTYAQYAITGLWSSLLRELNAAPRKELSIEKVVPIWLEQIKQSGVLTDILPGITCADPPIREIIQRLEKIGGWAPGGASVRSLQEVVSEGAGKSSAVSEFTLADRLDDEYEADRIYALALVSTVLLVATLLRWRKADVSAWAFDWALYEGGHQRLSVRSLGEDLEERKELRLSQFLAWALRKYVVDQHFFFATEKLLGGRDTFHFERGDSGLRLIEEDEGGWYGANYVQSSMRLLHALHLLDWDEDAGTFSITKDGIAALA